MHSPETAQTTISCAHGLTSPALNAHVLMDLAEDRGDTRLSLYLPLPAGAALGPKTRIRLKNLLTHAERALVTEGMRAADAEKLVEAVGTLFERALGSDQPGGGLAVFAGPRRIRSFRVPLALPQLVVVGKGYAVGPLLPLLTAVDRFFTLTLSQDEIALYQGNRYRLEPMDLDGLEIATWLTMPPTRPAQVHAFVAGRGGSTTQPIFHSTSGDDDRKVRLLQHMRGVDRTLREILNDRDVPLVLAGVRSLQDIYRRANGHPNLLPQGIGGNPRDLRPDALHRRSWAIVEPALHRAESAAILRFAELRGAQRTLHDVDDVLAAAGQGRIEILFVVTDTDGRRSTATGAPVIRREAPSGLAERLETAAIATLRHGGAVFAVSPGRMPDGNPVAAGLRY